MCLLLPRQYTFKSNLPIQLSNNPTLALYGASDENHRPQRQVSYTSRSKDLEDSRIISEKIKIGFPILPGPSRHEQSDMWWPKGMLKRYMPTSHLPSSARTRGDWSQCGFGVLIEYHTGSTLWHPSSFTSHLALPNSNLRPDGFMDTNIGKRIRTSSDRCPHGGTTISG